MREMQKYSKAEIKIFRLIGEFVYSFEKMLSAVKYYIVEYCKTRGLRDDVLIEILLHDSTAKPLLEYFKAIVLHDFSSKPTSTSDLEDYKELWKDIDSAISLRNDIVHAYWYTDFRYSDDEKTIFQIKASKKKVRSTGLQDVMGTFDASKIKQLKESILENYRITNLVHSSWFHFKNGRDFNFIYEIDE